MSTADKVKELIAEQLNKSIDEITDDKEVVKDLGADSLDVVEMLMSLEEEFSITVPEEDAVNIKTVGDIIKVIEENN
jgi:acyl carrier protein